MKYSAIERLEPDRLGVRPDQAVKLVGSSQVVNLFVQAGWISTVVQGNRLTLYDYSQLKSAWERLKREGMDKLREDAHKSE